MGRHGENIRKRKDGRWEGRYKIFDESKGRNIYRSIYGRTYGEVKEKLWKSKLKITDSVGEQPMQIPTDSTMILFSRAAEEWLGEIAEKRKYSTYVKYTNVYQLHLAGTIGSYQLSPAGAKELQTKIFDHISREALSDSLQKSICCIVNQILDFANQKYAANVPLLQRPQVKQKQKAVRIFSKADQARLLNCIHHGPDKFKIAVLLCLHTGLRLGELCALQWTDIDLEGMTLTVNRTVQRIAVPDHPTRTILLEMDPKSESSKRIIPLTQEIVQLLTQLMDGRTYVFGTEKPLDPRTMQYQFKKLLESAGVDVRNFHMLRHTFATNCVENCMDAKALSEILGHSDVKITLNRYVHPTMDSKRKQIGMLLGFYGQICGQAA